MNPDIPHWQPLSQDTQQNQLVGYDKMRRHCPIAYSNSLHYSVLGHAELLEVLHDHKRFSNQAGRHLSVPNGMDPPLHGIFRTIIEPYFNQTAMEGFQPLCLAICEELVGLLPKGQQIDVVSNFAELFALKIQCAFMGWPSQLEQPLQEWLNANQQAIFAQDRAKLTVLAHAFDGYICEQLDARRRPDYQPVGYDVTWQLMQEQVDTGQGSRVLTNEELVSIIRNWTVGELGTIAASVAIICHYLAVHPGLQDELRECTQQQLSDAIDEILRINPPLISNRRKTTKSVTLAETHIPQGEILTLLWASANRDEKVFGTNNSYAPERNKVNNLLYGAGLHQCPGAPLARMELTMLIEQLLLKTKKWTKTEKLPITATFPAGGFKQLFLVFY